MDVTTVADDLVVIHDGTTVHRFDGLAPDTDHRLFGVRVPHARPSDGRAAVPVRHRQRRALRRDRGGPDRRPDPNGPIRRAAPGGRAVSRGDEPRRGRRDGGDRPRRGDRQGRSVRRRDRRRNGRRSRRAIARHSATGCSVVRGNHDAYHHQDAYAGDQWIELPGLAVALLDTAIPGATTGTITTEQLEWLDDRAGGDRSTGAS